MKGDVKDVLLHSGLQRQHKDAFSELLVQKQTGNFETAVCRLRSSPQVWFKSINERPTFKTGAAYFIMSFLQL